ncbi:MAG: sulfoxide reductase heme-binding subunit YedZ [Chloroflexaceae bacterium]|nr:sulfoxide reductase heme-binding subunit YedZ [Chloroflexaceae bacterium]
MNSIQKHWLQILAHIGALAPLALLGWDYTHGNLSFNPVSDIISCTGKAGLILLLLSLACTPVVILFGTQGVLRLRRMLGLYAFAYVCLHLVAFVGLDYRFAFDLVLAELAVRYHLMAGTASFLILALLAVTSTRSWMRDLGKNWKRLHSLTYLAAFLAVLHTGLVVRADFTEPLIYGVILGVLLFVRIPFIRFLLDIRRS